MALVRCKECDNQVSSKAKTCPNCGASVPKRPLAIICAGVFIVLAALGALNGNQNSATTNPASQTTVSALRVNCNIFREIESPRTAPARFEVTIGAGAQGDPRKPVVVGKTNLPVGTKLMISLERPESAYRAEAEATVDKQGCFKGGPFMQRDDPINTGTYTIDVLMPVTAAQPPQVSPIIGDRGQHIYGPLVRRFQHLGKIAEFRTGYSVGQANSAKDAEAKQKTEAKSNARQDQLRSSFVVLLARRLRQNLRNPSSADWVSVLANDDATVVCIVLRAQNGFGGMTVDQYAFVDGNGSMSASVWHRHCAGKYMHDLTSTVKWTL